MRVKATKASQIILCGKCGKEIPGFRCEEFVSFARGVLAEGAGFFDAGGEGFDAGDDATLLGQRGEGDCITQHIRRPDRCVVG